MNDTSTSTPRYVFLQNASSGDIDAGRLRNILLRELRARDVPFTFVLRSTTDSVADTINRATAALSHPDDCLVAVGGDGTINMAAAAALRGNFAFGIIPAGTFNFVARTHGIPEQTEAALDMLLSTPARATQAALVNDKTFLVNASIGLYAKLLRERETAKRLLGRNRFVASLSAVYTAVRPYRDFLLALHGKGGLSEVRATTFIVGNNRLQLDLIGVQPPDAVGRGALFGALLRPTGRLALLDIIRRGLSGDVGGTPSLETFTLDNLTVNLPSTRRRKVVLAVDGELLTLPLPLVFSIDPRPLRLIHPELLPLALGAAEHARQPTT